MESPWKRRGKKEWDRGGEIKEGARSGREKEGELGKDDQLLGVGTGGLIQGESPGKTSWLHIS